MRHSENLYAGPGKCNMIFKGEEVCWHKAGGKEGRKDEGKERKMDGL